MFVIYMATCLTGTAATAALVGQYSLWLGLLAAPLGGSVSALAATPLALRRPANRRRETMPQGVVWG